jgi:hypothetical protein
LSARGEGEPALKRYGIPVAVLLGVVLAAAAVALPRFVHATASPVTVACRPWEALHVTGTDHQPYVVRNKPSINHNNLGMCVSDRGLGAAFTVTRSPGTGYSSTVRAYPNIGTGCFKGSCAGGRRAAALPRAGSLGNYTVHWATVTPPHSGVWDVSLDLWLGPHSGAETSEVMIWLRYSKPSWWAQDHPEVTIDGTQWYVVTTPANIPGGHYISFRRATAVSSATLRLAPFMAVAERYGAVSASWLLWSTQAGFEIWSGGKGLAVTHFSITQ